MQIQPTVRRYSRLYRHTGRLVAPFDFHLLGVNVFGRVSALASSGDGANGLKLMLGMGPGLGLGLAN